MLPDSTSNSMEGKQKSAKKRKKKDGGTSEKPGKKKTEKSGKKGGKKKKKDSNEEDSDLDLNRVLKPIGDYIKDREEMIEQIFKSVKGAQLDNMIPAVMKKIPLDELKRLSLEQLEVISKKRIRRIMAGDDPSTISSSGTDDETSEEELQTIGSQTQAAADSTSQSAEVEEAPTTEAEQPEINEIPVLADPQSHTVAPSSPTVCMNTDEVLNGEQGEIIEDDAKTNCSVSETSEKQDIDSAIEEDNTDLDTDQSETRDIMDAENEGLEVEDVDGIEEDEEFVENADADVEIEDDNFSDNEQEPMNTGEEDGEIVSDDPELEELVSDIKSSAGNNTDITLSKTQMEIFELEMRARAIKAMLNAAK